MELREFLEKFLLEYEQRKNGIEELHRDEDDFSMADANVVATVVATEYFPEALENFADMLCEKQRRYCADIVEDRINDHECEPFKDGIYVDSSEVLEAEQPKIEELLEAEQPKIEEV